MFGIRIYKFPIITRTIPRFLNGAGKTDYNLGSNENRLILTAVRIRGFFSVDSSNRRSENSAYSYVGNYVRNRLNLKLRGDVFA